MCVPVFSIKEEGSDDVFGFSNRISIYYGNGDGLSRSVSFSSEDLVRLVRKRVDALLEDAIQPDHSFWVTSG